MTQKTRKKREEEKKHFIECDTRTDMEWFEISGEFCQKALSMVYVKISVFTAIDIPYTFKPAVTKAIEANMRMEEEERE